MTGHCENVPCAKIILFTIIGVDRFLVPLYISVAYCFRLSHSSKDCNIQLGVSAIPDSPYCLNLACLVRALMPKQQTEMVERTVMVDVVGLFEVSSINLRVTTLISHSFFLPVAIYVDPAVNAKCDMLKPKIYSTTMWTAA